MKYDLESINRRKENVKIVRKVLEIIAIILIYNVILVIISSSDKMNLINIFGYKSYIIKTNSMETTINIGDIVLTKETKKEKINTGDVITFLHEGEVITHRITKIHEDNGETQYTTKGDNNNIEDTFKIVYDDIEGKHILTIPYLGKVIQILDNKIIILIITLIILIFMFTAIIKEEKRDNRREKKKIEDNKRKNIF